ncbi:predicted protein [Chaetoceros tenuissimus]|uniref:Uncharacterized protein n=1 Tax=Chaetoceros tenuissimus TaxID=426638 RepID=A0AAD3D416_9STRA|nr:predicted protein [Chaetoceros tenuissimus]
MEIATAYMRNSKNRSRKILIEDLKYCKETKVKRARTLTSYQKEDWTGHVIAFDATFGHLQYNDYEEAQKIKDSLDKREYKWIRSVNSGSINSSSVERKKDLEDINFFHIANDLLDTWHWKREKMLSKLEKFFAGEFEGGISELGQLKKWVENRKGELFREKTLVLTNDHINRMGKLGVFNSDFFKLFKEKEKELMQGRKKQSRIQRKESKKKRKRNSISIRQVSQPSPSEKESAVL